MYEHQVHTAMEILLYVIRYPEPTKKDFRTWRLASESVTLTSYDAPPLFKPQCFQNKISTMTPPLGSLVM